MLSSNNVILMDSIFISSTIDSILLKIFIKKLLLFISSTLFVILFSLIEDEL